MANESKFLCYLDILGFKNRIADDDFKRCYEKIGDNIQAYNFADKIYVISDSIVIISENFSDVVNNSFAIYSDALGQGLFLRGGITKGQINKLPVVQETDNKIVIPYLGEAYLAAYKLEENINCAAICIDQETYDGLQDGDKKLIFSYKELFPKDDIKKEKLFLISDMYNNYSVPRTILFKISEQINHLSKHDLLKFMDTFFLYYRVMREKHKDTNNVKTYHTWWINILDRLSKNA
ncbi:MAG: hypothetical protein A2Z09_03680 [Nitrospirae bacterium RBG_16_43_8]|nr:MAG: hypothetical protein A2Z09_03680 [Nitrospirae bacterium RBG_16_43_8]